jgi:hypothetical protein
VIAAEKWPVRRYRYPRLGAYLSVALPTALIDFLRSSYGRNRYKRVLDSSVAAQSLRDACADEDDWDPAEPIDERLEARVEDFVPGYVDLKALAGGRIL